MSSFEISKFSLKRGGVNKQHKVLKKNHMNLDFERQKSCCTSREDKTFLESAIISGRHNIHIANILASYFPPSMRNNSRVDESV